MAPCLNGEQERMSEECTGSADSKSMAIASKAGESKAGAPHDRSGPSRLHHEWRRREVGMGETS
jgi:hypothetical protein